MDMLGLLALNFTVVAEDIDLAPGMSPPHHVAQSPGPA
jgi:hypothetical protein